MRLNTLSTLLLFSLTLNPVIGLSDELTATEPLVGTVTLPVGQSTEASVSKALEPGSSKYHRSAPLKSLVHEPRRVADPELPAEASDLESLAEERALDFDLVGAAKILREAADKMRLSAWVLIDPVAVGLLHVKAAAASADADEDDLALRYFRLALAIDSNSASDNVLSPKATGFFHRAEETGPLQFGLPGNAVLSKICSKLGLDGIVLLTASSEKGETTVTEHLYFPQAKSIDPETHHRLPGAAGERDAWVSREKQRLEGLITAKFQPHEEPTRPWYKRWWVYASVGGAIAAGVISAFAISNATEDPLVDVTVHH